MDKLNQIKLEQIKQRLTTREAYIIIKREGLDGSKMSLNQIGKQLNISITTVWQLEKKAYEKLESKYFNDKICVY